ncbi:hypothetical protein NAB22_18025 [Proteus mirabilis]|nr:hypothetical protein [Proteus mirabilis]
MVLRNVGGQPQQRQGEAWQNGWRATPSRERQLNPIWRELGMWFASCLMQFILNAILSPLPIQFSSLSLLGASQ